MKTEPDLKGCTILIIDDSPINLSVIVDYLEEASFELMVARDGESGLEIAQRAQPDLILLDVIMPGIDGFETCRQLKANENTQDIPVIFMTALTSIEDKVKGFSVGGVDYITKPIQQEEVLARVTTHLKIKVLTEHLQKINQDLIKLNADKDRLFSIVAHDLKGPFMPIIGTAQYLLETGENLSKEELKELYNVIHISAQKVADLLENLLAWSRMQIGGMPYQPSQVDLTSLVERNINLFSQNATNKKITLQSHINQPVSVYADEHMLDTIMRNLISNAIKFTPNGGAVTLSTRIQGMLFIEVAVMDTGVGFNQEVLDNLLQGGLPQITMGTANEKGSGLGLMICREMVAHQGGQFWIESQPGRDTTVKFTVPQG